MRLPNIFHALLPVHVRLPDEAALSVFGNHNCASSSRPYTVELFVVRYMVDRQTALTVSGRRICRMVRFEGPSTEQAGRHMVGNE
jgi:hypothetical protein